MACVYTRVAITTFCS